MIFTLLAGWLSRCGVTREWTGRVAPLLLAAAATAVLALFAALALHVHDNHVRSAAVAKATAAEAPARDAAADQRISDALANANERETFHAAIDASGATGAPDPADVALACQWLRRAGIALPAGC